MPLTDFGGLKMGRTTKILGFSIPPEFREEFEQLAKKEGRTKSELFRECFRFYKRYQKEAAFGSDLWIKRVIAEGKDEAAREPMTEDELIQESEELARYGATQARKLGIKEKDVKRIIYEARRRWKAEV